MTGHVSSDRLDPDASLTALIDVWVSGEDAALPDPAVLMRTLAPFASTEEVQALAAAWEGLARRIRRELRDGRLTEHQARLVLTETHLALTSLAPQLASIHSDGIHATLATTHA